MRATQRGIVLLVGPSECSVGPECGAEPRIEHIGVLFETGGCEELFDVFLTGIDTAQNEFFTGGQSGRKLSGESTVVFGSELNGAVGAE